MSKLPLWELFKRTVEGRPGPASVVMQAGRPGFSREPIPKGAPPDTRPLVDLLRSGEPIPPDVRAWLADLLEVEKGAPLRLEFVHGRGARAGVVLEHWEAAEFVDARVKGGEKEEAAVLAAQKHFGLARSTIFKVLRSFREVEAIRMAEFADGDEQT